MSAHIYGKIDHNIPIPKRWNQILLDLGVGDSVLFPFHYTRVYNYVNYAKEKCKFKFTTRKVNENGMAGTRVWRIK